MDVFHCCACEVTLVIVGHINRFFLLTYLLFWMLTIDPQCPDPGARYEAVLCSTT